MTENRTTETALSPLMIVTAGLRYGLPCSRHILEGSSSYSARASIGRYVPLMELSVSYSLSNILIDSLPDANRKELLPHLTPVSLPVKTSLYEPEDTPKYVHFLTSGLASIVTSMADGETTEVGTVGREGMPQGVHLLGPVSITTRCFMQIAGTALRMDYKAFERIFNKEESVRRSTLAYAQYQTILLGQVAGCNRLHDVEARLARWLLMVQDRTADSVLALTQEFLGQMMGSQRTTVSSVAGGLQQRGLIEYTRGKVRILNRTGLENAACECYAATRKILAILYLTAGQSLFDEAPSNTRPLENCSGAEAAPPEKPSLPSEVAPAKRHQRTTNSGRSESREV